MKFRCCGPPSLGEVAGGRGGGDLIDLNREGGLNRTFAVNQRKVTQTLHCVLHCFSGYGVLSQFERFYLVSPVSHSVGSTISQIAINHRLH